MVNPSDAAAQLLGIDPARADGRPRPSSPGALITAAILRAGRDCAPCESCRLLQQLGDALVDSVTAPFPSRPPSETAPAAPAPAPDPAPTPPAPAAELPVGTGANDA